MPVRKARWVGLISLYLWGNHGLNGWRGLSKVTQQAIIRTATEIQLPWILANLGLFPHTILPPTVQFILVNTVVDFMISGISGFTGSHILPLSLPFSSQFHLKGFPLLQFHPASFCPVKQRKTGWQQCQMINCNTVWSSAPPVFHSEGWKTEAPVKTSKLEKKFPFI